MQSEAQVNESKGGLLRESHAAVLPVAMHNLRPLVILLTCLLGAGEPVASEAVLALALEGAQTIEAACIDVTR